jgi:vacuolar-type H+-ATPase subunit B/Vma2
MLAETYYKLGESQKGDAIMEAVAKDCVEYLEWYYTLTVSQRNSVNNRIGHNLAVLNQILRICDQENQKNILDKYLPVYMKYTKNVEL